MDQGSSKDPGILYQKWTESQYRRRIPSQLHRIFRICERLPQWVPTPDAFFNLPETRQAQLLAFELVREAEEAELFAPRSM